MADTIADQITETAVAGIKSATTDGTTTEALPVGDLIKAHQYAALLAAVSAGYTGIRLTKVIPAGAMSDCGGTRTGGNCWP